jgi:hypothetical protein
MTNRQHLPARRRSETFDLQWGGLAMPHTITVGFFEDGRIGEVFINGGKSGEQVEAIARDGAISLSFALQYGADINAIGKAVTRDARGVPQTIVGAVVDQLVELAKTPVRFSLRRQPQEPK